MKAKFLMIASAATAMIFSADSLSADENTENGGTAMTEQKAEDKTPERNYSMFVFMTHHKGTAKVGEKITFFPVLRAGSVVREGKVSYVIKKNWKDVIQYGEIDMTNFSPYVEYTPNMPMCITAEFTFKSSPEAKPLTYMVGVLVEPEKFTPVTPYPADFKEFWAKQLDALSKVPPNVKMVHRPSQYGIEVFDVTADCVGGKPMKGELVRPSNPQKGKHPAVIIFQGAGVNASGSLANGSYLARRGFIAMEVNAHGMENGQSPEYYKHLAENELSFYFGRFFEADKPENAPIKNMFLRAKRAVDVIASMPEWDGEHIVVFGNSQGAWQSIAAASLDDRVSKIVIGMPAGCDIFCGDWPYLYLTDENRERCKANIPYFDAANFARNVKCPVHLEFGLIDDFCHGNGVLATINAMQSKDKVINYYYNTGHDCCDGAVANEDEAIVSHGQEKCFFKKLFSF